MNLEVGANLRVEISDDPSGADLQGYVSGRGRGIEPPDSPYSPPAGGAVRGMNVQIEHALYRPVNTLVKWA